MLPGPRVSIWQVWSQLIGSLSTSIRGSTWREEFGAMEANSPYRACFNQLFGAIGFLLLLRGGVPGCTYIIIIGGSIPSPLLWVFFLIKLAGLPCVRKSLPNPCLQASEKRKNNSWKTRSCGNALRPREFSADSTNKRRRTAAIIRLRAVQPSGKFLSQVVVTDLFYMVSSPGVEPCYQHDSEELTRSGNYDFRYSN